MNFTNLDIFNFLTIGEAHVELNDRGLLLIQGKNEDDPSAESNGAGKSSVVDALCWALYGVTARGVAGDSVVNRTAKKDCQVFVFIQDGTDSYKVERFRKHSTGKNQLRAWKLDPAGPSIDMSKGTDKETQEVVNALIGCSLEVFMSAVYCGQEMMPDLPGMTDKMLKTLIEEAAGVEVLTEAYTVARGRYNTVKSSFDATRESHAAGVTQRANLASELGEQVANSAAFEAERKDRARAELAKVIPIKADIAQMTAELAGYDEPAIKTEMDGLQGKLDAHKAQQTEMDALVAQVSLKGRHVAHLKAQIEAATLAIQRADKAVVDVDGQVGKACGSCGKEYHAEDLCDVKGIREDDAKKARTDAKPLAVAYKTAVEAETTASATATVFKAAMTDVSAVAARQRDLSALVLTIAGKRTAIKTLEFEIARHNDAAKVKLTEANPWTKAIEGAVRSVGLHEAYMTKQTIRVEGLLVEVELLADAVKVFGPAGVRAHVLDTVTPYLNDRTQDYLGALADGNIHAVWSTLTKTGKGELKEKFNIEVVNDKGAESFAGLSGGEKRKVRLATAMALQDMVASRATKPIGIFIADEVDHALDEAGLERLMGVLERKAKEKGTVLVVSHASLRDWIDDVITVTKSGGLATVAGAVKRGV